MDPERRWGCWLCVWLAWCVTSKAAEQPVFEIKEHYTKSQHMVPMRDGTRLFTTVYQPIEKGRPYPVMLFRTPYSTGPYAPDQFPKRLGPSIDFAREGYLFVYQDVRGKFRSEGTFVVMKPLRPCFGVVTTSVRVPKMRSRVPATVRSRVSPKVFGVRAIALSIAVRMGCSKRV